MTTSLSASTSIRSPQSSPASGQARWQCWRTRSGAGDGAPSGPHFNLNIHGVAKGEGFNGNNKNDIFVPLSGTCKINLVRAALYGTFSVLNPDCVHNPPASFELPDPCVDAAGVTTCPSTFSYSVWTRALSPKGQAFMT